MGREQLHVVLVSLVSESDPNYATYDAVLSVETDHTGFNLDACNHFNTDQIKVVVHGQFAYPLPEFLKLVERHRVGTDQLEGEQCADGSFLVRRPVRYQVRTQQHISPDATLPAPPTIAKLIAGSEDQDQSASVGMSEQRSSNKNVTQEWVRDLREAMQKLWPRSEDGTRFMWVSADLDPSLVLPSSV